MFWASVLAKRAVSPLNGLASMPTNAKLVLLCLETKIQYRLRHEEDVRLYNITITKLFSYQSEWRALPPIVFYSKFKLPYLRLAAFTIIRFQNIYLFRARSHFATTTQIFDIVTMSSEMGCIVINITVCTWRQKKHIVVAMCERALR